MTHPYKTTKTPRYAFILERGIYLFMLVIGSFVGPGLFAIIDIAGHQTGEPVWIQLALQGLGILMWTVSIIGLYRWNPNHERH